MRTILLGLCVLTLFAGLTQKTAAQTVTMTLGPPTVDADWVWSDEYQCWLWNGPEFQGDYQGHSFFKEHFLNHQFFNFFEGTPASFWLPLPSIQLNAIAGGSWSAKRPWESPTGPAHSVCLRCSLQSVGDQLRFIAR